MACVIVLGCYRSGTSAVAGVLHHLGVMMGKEFDPPAHTNPTGFFEDLDFKRICDKLMLGKEVEGQLAVVVKLREAEYPLWGVKDPQLCLLLPKLVPLLKDHRIISTLRPKEDICKSLSEAGIFAQPPERFEPLVDYYLQRKADNLAVYSGPVLEVDFETLKTDRVAEVERIANFVNLPVKQEAIDFISAGGMT
jgi:hypothetical protein